jgi:hypothetical protein
LDIEKAEFMTTVPLPAAIPVPTQDERTMALLVNVLAIFPASSRH